MKNQPNASVKQLVGEVGSDFRALLRQELALARRELSANLDNARSIGLLLGAGGALLAVGALFLLLSLARVIADLFDWPEWAGEAIVGGTLALAGLLGLSAARREAAEKEVFPHETVETLRENAEWLANRAGVERR